MPIIKTPPAQSILMARRIYDANGNNIVDTVDAFHWKDLLSKPTAFPPLPHTHLISDIIGLSNALATFTTKESLPLEIAKTTYTKPETDALLATKAPIIHFHDDRYYTKAGVDEITNPETIDSGLSTVSPLLHKHDDRYYDKAKIDELVSQAPTSLTNDARYYTKPEVDSAISTRAPLLHHHDSLYYTKDQVDARLAVLGDGLYVYDPGVPLSQWDIHHGLGRMPTVNVVVSGELALARVIYPDSDSITIYFASPQVGQAYLT